MGSSELEWLDPPTCPYLGLAGDSRSHYTYAHPGHRCFATGRPVSADARRQTTYCVTPGYAACDRYPKGADAATVVYVFRAGDSLARIAGKYGLSVEQIAEANRLPLDSPVADGTRLVIPLRTPDKR